MRTTKSIVNALETSHTRQAWSYTSPSSKVIPNPFKVPVSLIGAKKDGFFTPDEIKATGNQYSVTPVFFDGGHVLVLEENWKDVASSINEWLMPQGF